MRVLVGTAQCAGCETSHRTHTCTACWFTIYTPQLTDRCDLRALDNRRVNPGDRGRRAMLANPSEEA
ncbi:putative uncharacterized protein [Mycolicibacterium fortuitum subsp. acetamidolyticum]|nr:hypothetical protein [Mycolicibacterium fortuitum]GAT01884.1 putative uncharacterized protein [Mycolicibacterium fortuitum subsp. acetamidolyticum]MDV7194576.1 hypothetical protein [Mycolicibacterium fortuitum]MDV7230032.1 hypothetical protein [Mycolicibacterium fortuitum]MDV7261837.1 hypothetical protein [Mycolicibacterium fortuitum]MDV7308937.1 hypothetical protein [Mycolicibacterium fortuitum]